LIERFKGYSASGGAFGPGGILFVSGHDAKELYLLELPPGGGEARWFFTLPISAAGQAFAWELSDAARLYAIDRATREVIVSEVK
ncbi:MAG: lactonase family protein, partial [Verrucomicrobiae bacterium]|nr:lactonase family protein [Verrucomicrobiae bacterium]